MISNCPYTTNSASYLEVVLYCNISSNCCTSYLIQQYLYSLTKFDANQTTEINENKELKSENAEPLCAMKTNASTGGGRNGTEDTCDRGLLCPEGR